MFVRSAGLVSAGAAQWGAESPDAAAAALGAAAAGAGASACHACRACRLHDAPALCDALRRWHRCPELHKAIDGINYIADQTRKEEESTRVRCTMNPQPFNLFLFFYKIKILNLFPQTLKPLLLTGIIHKGPHT